MRQLAALTAALLLVVAGCNGAPGGGTLTETTADGATTTAETTATTTETAETTTETATATETTATAPNADFPPGLSESGVTDSRTLTDAHANVLRNTSYAVETNLTARGNGTVLARSNTTLRVAAGGTPQVNRYEVGGERPGAVGAFAYDVEAWTDENRTLYAMEGPNGTTYQRVSAEDRPPLRPSGRDHLYVLLSGFETTVTGTETRNGTTHYRVNSTGIAMPEVLANTLRTETVRNASLSALITEDGLIREYRVEYAGTVGNATIRVEQATRFTRLGETTVERPPWYDEAVNATDG